MAESAGSDPTQVAAHRAAMPADSGRFLDRRSLATDHRVLAALLKPGMAVLDVGCGSGAITRGIADAVAPNGRVVGIDVSRELLDAAVAASGGHANLRYKQADILADPYSDEFDVVNAARVLQWLADPLEALRAMAAAARPGGRLVVLDYDHTAISWEPAVPQSVQRFYEAFLDWRAGAGMDNRIAERLADMFEAIALSDIAVTSEDEESRCADEGIALWGDVIATRGHQLVADGFLTERERAEAGAEFARWSARPEARQVLRLKAAVGTKDVAHA